MKPLTFLLCVLCVLCGKFSQAADITRFPAADLDAPPEAVRVVRGDLAHTRLLEGLDIGSGDFGFADIVDQLADIARANDATLADVAKLNLYLAQDSAALRAAIHEGIRQTWPAHARPAVTIVPSRGTENSIRVSADAVIALEKSSMKISRAGGDSAALPAKRDILYLSGRAATGDLPEATAGTMTQLFDVLAHLGAKPADIVQVKAFIKPITGWKSVQREIQKSFGSRPAPPVVFVEWTSGSRATEIELIAAAPEAAASNESVSYFTPPGDKSSPVYSRVARLHGNEVIYIGGLTGTAASTPEEEVTTLYSELERISKRAGTDLRHFTKATYYVSESDVSKALNELRPKYYDPARPPAASKIAVPSLGIPNRGLLIDMTAAPAGD